MPSKSVIAPRKKPLQARSRATVEALVEATARVLVQGGYDALTTNRVAERAGVNIASLYQYFPNKDALVAALVDRQLEATMHNVWTAHEAARHLAIPAWIERMVDAFLALKLRGPKLYRALAQELPRVERLSVTVRLKKASVEALTPFFVERRAELRLPAPRAAYAFVQMMASLTEAAVLEGEGVLSDRAHRELLVDVLRRALCP